MQELVDQKFELEFVEESMLSILSVLSKFRIVENHPSVDMYVILPFEPIHCISLGLGKMSKECIILMLDDKSRLSSAIRCANGKMRPFKYIQRAVLSTLNTFLERRSMRSSVYGLKVDFSKL